jgi:hypothetical protein
MRTVGDPTLDYMRAHPELEFSLKTYVELNWLGDKTVEEVLDDPELESELPFELYPAAEGSC